MLKLNELYADYLKMMGQLISGEINFERYFNKRGINPRVKLNEVKYITNNPIMFNSYISKISIGVRCMVMKAVFDLNDRQIVDISYSLSNTYNSKSTISDFIKDYLTNLTNSNLNKKRTYSIELYYDLSIILDIPFRYIADPNVLYKMTNSFDEYERDKIKLYSFKELVEEVFTVSKNISGNERKIYGVKIKNEGFSQFENSSLNTRVDIRDRYFSIEIHIENESSLDYSKILIWQNLFKSRNQVYIRDAFLRGNKKMIFLVLLDDSINPDISYLRNDQLLGNLLFLDDILTRSRKI